jgi:hypothetical protein
MAALAAAIAPRNPALWMPLLWTAVAAIAVLAVARRPSPLPIAVLLMVHALDLFYFVSLSEPTPSAASALLPPPSAVAARQALPDSAMRVVLMADGPLVTDCRWLLWGTRLVNGYDPFMLTRYGDFADGMSYWGQLSTVIIAQRPWFLDLLGARVAVVSKPQHNPAGYGVVLAPGEALEFVPAAPRRATAVTARTALTDGADLTDGTAVARATVWDAGGEPTELTLRAGDHTAQWDWDAAGGAARIRHRRAPMAVDDGSSGAPFYGATIPLPHPVDVARLRLEYLQPAGALAVDGVALGDAAAGSVVPLGGLDALRANPQRWVPRVDAPTFAVFENRRAMPRAWLVGETVAAPPSEQLWILRSGRLSDGRPFDPQTVALVDEGGHDRGPPRDADVQIVGESPTRIELITRSATPAFLVLSEVFYPGWSAAVDGTPVSPVRTDYVLRGIEVPAGEHRVTYVFRPASVAAGAAVSAATVAFVVVTAVWRRRRRRASAADQFA